MRTSLAVCLSSSVALLPAACASPNSSAPAAEEAAAKPMAPEDPAAAAAPDADADADAVAEPSVNAEDAPAQGAPPSPDPAAPSASDGATPGRKDSTKARELGELKVAVPALNGGLDRDIIRRKVSDQLDDVRGCYGRGLDASADLGSDLGGALVIHVEIDGDGEVTEATLAEQNAIMSKQVQDCVLELVGGWSFDAPGNAKPTRADLSFTLE